MKPVPHSDLIHIMDHTRDLWEELRGESLFITGGTGFFGRWLLESFIFANSKLNLRAKTTVLSRAPEAFKAEMPHLAQKRSITFIRGDVNSFEFPRGNYPFIIHAATESKARLNQKNPLQMVDTIVGGTKRVLDFAQSNGTRKLLLTSSGAVYGKQPENLFYIPETFMGAPDTMNTLSAYGEGKRCAEMLSTIYSNQFGFEVKIARCFAFVGPHLPLDQHFAIGNFIRDGMNGGPIKVFGDGTPFRSYLYAADLVIWLWTILLKGHSNIPYNVGSADAIDIKSLAEMVKRNICPDSEVIIAQPAQPGALAERYIPSIERIKNELDLNVYITLEQAILKTVLWLRECES